MGKLKSSMPETDYYAALEVSPTASEAEVKKAYRSLIRENHPDILIAQGMPQEFIDLANEKMAQINTAYEQIKTQRSIS